MVRSDATRRVRYRKKERVAIDSHRQMIASHDVLPMDLQTELITLSQYDAR